MTKKNEQVKHVLMTMVLNDLDHEVNPHENERDRYQIEYDFLKIKIDFI